MTSCSPCQVGNHKDCPYGKTRAVIVAPCTKPSDPISLVLQEHNRQGRQSEGQGVEATMAGNRAGFQAAQVALLAAAVLSSVTVQRLFPEAATRDPHLIVVAEHRREVADDQNTSVRRAPCAEKAEDTVLGVVAIDPVKPSRGTVLFVEGRLTAVELVQILYPALQAGMGSMRKQVPLQAGIVVPLSLLAKLPSHKEQLLPGLGVQVPQQQSQVGELLPLIPRHLAQERPLAVHHFIVGQRQDEVFRER